MAKKTYAERKEELGTLKEDSKQARKDLKNFCKENKLDPEAENADNKKFVKLKALVTKTSTDVAEAEKWLADNKEVKERAQRKSNYEYPADCTTAADKKKWRAKARAAAKKKAKEESGEGSSKKSKKAKEEKVADAPEAKTSDKAKKKKKKATTEASED